jgi:hypothetical protein
MSKLNPTLVCPSCGFTARLDEASRLGLLCPRCQVELVHSGGSDAMNTPSISIHDAMEGLSEEIVVADLVLPSQNIRDVPEVVSFLSAIPRPVALEFYGSHLQVSLRLRGPKSIIDSLSSSIPMHWPGSYLHVLDPSEKHQPSPSGSDAYGIWVTLKKDPFLPLTFWDSFLRGDPMHSLLSAFQGLSPDQGLWLQLYLPAPTGEPAWLSQIRERIKLEKQRGYQVQGGGQTEAYAVITPATNPSPAFSWRSIARLFFFFGLFGAVILVILAGIASPSNLLWSLPLGFALLLLSLWIISREHPNDAWQETDLDVVREKISQNPITPVSIRLISWASSPAEGGNLLRRVLSSLEKYGRADGNTFGVYEKFDAYPDPAWPEDLPELPACWLGPKELAVLWHVPVVTEQVALPLMKVNTTEWRAPLPQEVAGPNPIGESCSPDNRIRVPVSLSRAAQQGGIFMDGKTRSGKSTLMEFLFDLCMKDPRCPAAIISDPHGDLARRVVGMVPPERLKDVVFWDVLDPEYSIGMNPLDMYLPGNTIQDAVQLMLDVGESLWTDYWGPRMRIPLQRSLTAIAAANTKRARDKQLGPSALSFLLNAKDTVRNEFLNQEVRGTSVADEVLQYFMGEFDHLMLSLRQQIIQPVTSKAHRFEEEPALWLFSPPQSTLSLDEVINKRKILILSTHQLSLGDDLSGFIGALVVNFAIRALGEQEFLPIEERIPLYLIADEFQSIPCVRWQVFLQQMRKLGGVPVLGTQSLSSLRKFDPHLPSIIFSGVQTLVSFQVTGEDAEELSKGEFIRTGGGPGMESLINLDPHQAWIRTISEDKHTLLPFLVNLRPQIDPDESIITRAMALRRDYAVPLGIAKAQASSSLREWMQAYNITNMVSDGGSAVLQNKTFVATDASGAASPQYANRPSALTADLPEGLHDVIAAPQTNGRRQTKKLDFQPSVPDPTYLRAAQADPAKPG